MTLLLDYTSFRAEPGILIEVFLPKRNRFQGILYDTLKDGFNRSKVITHFKDNKDEINGYLDWLQEKDIKSINEDMLKHFETVLWGYSIYEVDGVFAIKKNKLKSDERKNNIEGNNQENEFRQIISEDEERTQVIKIIFMPDYEKITSRLHEEADKKGKTFEKTKVIEIARELFLRYPEKNIRLHELKFDNKARANHFIQDLDVKYTEPIEAKLVEHLICYLVEWIGYTGVFLFGFLIFKICVEIEEKQHEHPPEKELWVTSHWDFLVNKVLHKKQ